MGLFPCCFQKLSFSGKKTLWEKEKMLDVFDENGRKLSKWIENAVGKGEIACYKQFLLFSHFQKACFPGLKRCHCLGIG